jgi:hypothetical protein
MVILKVHLIKETMYGKKRPLVKPEPILFFSANSKGNTSETSSFFFFLDVRKDF